MSLLFVQILSSLFFLLPLSINTASSWCARDHSDPFLFLTFSSALLCGASTFFLFFSLSTWLLLLMRWWWYYFSLSPFFFCYKERRWQRSVRSTLILIVDRKDKTGTETCWRTERFTWVPFNFCERDSFKAESTCISISFLFCFFFHFSVWYRLIWKFEEEKKMARH
jgi:hypothetical protein